jgi:hypothetical protein
MGRKRVLKVLSRVTEQQRGTGGHAGWSQLEWTGFLGIEGREIFIDWRI